MKIRNGFISNSSSSSFIVQLTKPIEQYTLEEFMKEYRINEMYKKQADCLFLDLQNQDFNIDERWDLSVSINSDKLRNLLTDDDYTEIIDDVCLYFKQQIMNKLESNKNTYIVEYSDENGSFYSKMEHEFMPNIPCTVKRISHH